MVVVLLLLYCRRRSTGKVVKIVCGAVAVCAAPVPFGISVVRVKP